MVRRGNVALPASSDKASRAARRGAPAGADPMRKGVPDASMKRFLKIVAILALFALAIAYVAFRVVFFDPFGSPRASLDPLLPKDVDFMARRKELARDFSDFPLPRVFAALRLKDEWKEFARTTWYRENVPAKAIEQAFDEVAALPAQVPELDLMTDVLGREALVCGRLRADGSVAWAAVARGSFKAKAAVEAMRLKMARDAMGGAVAEWSESENVQSFAAQGTRLHVARADDAIIAGNDYDLVRDMRKLADGDALSLDDSPQYRESVLSPSPTGRPIDFVVDVADVCKRLGWGFPEAKPGDTAGLAFARDLLAPSHFGATMGRLALGNHLELSLSATIDRVAMASAAAGLIDGASGDLAKAWAFCGKVFPAKVALVCDVRLDVRKFLRRLESLIDPDWRRIANEDFFPNLKFKAGPYQPKSVTELLEAFASVVGDEIVFALEPNDAYQQPGADAGVICYPDPRHGPRLAFILPCGDKDSATQFVTALVEALRARVREVPHVYSWTYPNLDDIKFSEIEFVDPSFPNLAIGVLELQKRPCIVVTTTGAMLDEICIQKLRAESGHDVGLQTELAWRQAQESAKGIGQGFAYVSSDRLRKVIEDLCPVFAEDATRPDWVKIRRDVERKVVATKFPELMGKTLDAAGHAKLDPVVDAEIEKLEKEWLEQALPAKTEELRGELRGLSVFRWSTLLMAVDDRELRLKLRLAAPVDFGDGLGGQ